MVNEEFDPRNYRPIEVVLDINIGDLTVHLIKNCLPKDPPCPFVVVEKLAFEMDKNYRETRLQLQLSPVVLRSSGSDKSENWSEQGNFRGVSDLKACLDYCEDPARFCENPNSCFPAKTQSLY